MEGESIYELIRDVLEEEREQDIDELLDFVSDGEEDGDKLVPPVSLNESFPTSVFIANTPKVGKEKHSKLLTIVAKYTDKCGPNEKYMPIDETTQQTYGFVIVTYEDEEAAKAAVERVNGVKLDKSHTFKVIPLDKYDEIVSRSLDFRAVRTLTSFSRADFRDWLTDKKCREQILLRYQSETEIYWNDTMAGMPVLCYGGENEKTKPGKVWCDWRVQWSPQGSYLATFHQQGIALWAGPEFEKKVRLPHANTKAIIFSPAEDYIMLWNGALPPSKNDPNADNEAYAIYHILTGQCVKKCRTPAFIPLVGEDFPHFLWSADGKFFAECNENRIMVRDTETFELIKDETGVGSALKFPALSTFQWSPKDNIIAAWTLEKDNNPARLVLVEIPTRTELASRSRTQCEATMHWQSEGDFLCLCVKKLTKTKKVISTNLEIFRIRERGTPVDSVTITDVVRGFYWESKGSRFAVLTADEAGLKPKLLIYSLGKEKVEELCNFDLPSNSFDSLFWAPDGQYFVVAATGGKMGGGGGDLLFAGLTPDNKLEILFKDEHYMLTTVQWDPSSRYVITGVTQEMDTSIGGGYKYSMEAGYSIRTFQGRILYRAQKEKLYHIAWRPHPPSLLSSDNQGDVRKNIKKFSKKYDAKDEQDKEFARKAFKRDREEKTNVFLAVLDRLNEYKEERGEESGWDTAMEAFLDGQGWTQDDQILYDDLDVTEELISGN